MSIDDVFIKKGKIQSVSKGNRFECDTPFTFWYVKKGAVDVFLKHKDSSMSDNALCHYYRVPEGELFCNAPNDDKSIWHIVARNCSDTQVYQLSLADFMQLDNSERDILSGLIDEFIIKITKLVKLEVIPNQCLYLNAQRTVILNKDDNITLAKGVSWVLSVGYGSLNGDEGEKIGHENWFPLTVHSWIHFPNATSCKIKSTDNLLQMGILWDGLYAYYKRMINLFVINIENESLFNNIILYDKIANNQLSMRHSLDALKESYQVKASTTKEYTKSSDAVFLACQNLANYYDLTLRPTLRLPHQTVAQQFKHLMQRSKIFYRKVYLSKGWEKKEHGPLFGIDEATQKPIGLLPTRGKGYIFKSIDSLAKISKHAYAIYRNFGNTVLGVKDVIKFGIQYARKDLILIVLCFLSIALMALLPPILMQIIFDNVIISSARQQLWEIGSFLLVIIIGTGAFELTKRYALLRFEATFDSQIQAAFWSRILRLPIQFFRQFTPGELVSRIARLIEIRFALSGPLLNLAMNTIFSFTSLILLFYYSAIASFIVVGIVVLVFAVYLVLMRYRLNIVNKIVSQQDTLFGMLGEFFSAITKIRLSGSECRIFYHWSVAFSKLQTNLRLSLKMSSLIKSMLETAPLVIITSAYAVLAFVVFKSQALSTGHFLAFNVVLIQLLVVIFDLLLEFNRIIEQIPYFQRCKIFIETLPELKNELADPGELKGNIEISNVSFKYPQVERWVLKDINIRIEPGQYVAIVGPSGSGKSTLIRLLLHFELPTEGAVYFDSNDVNQIDMDLLRQQMGVVLQNDQLIPGDLFSNIVGANDLTLKDAWDIAEKVGLRKDIKDMPMQMRTMINMEGIGLSGGQKERLLIARAIANQPKILILDEATRALDNKTQKHVITQLAKMKMTRIVIAHRLSTLQDVDMIYVLDQGRIAEFGTYQQLIESNNLFARLVHRQML